MGEMSLKMFTIFSFPFTQDFFIICSFNFCLFCDFVAVRRFSPFGERGGAFWLQSTGFSLRWLLLSCSTGSGHTGFSSCSTWAEVLCSMWDLPESRLETVSFAVANIFLSTVVVVVVVV